MFLTYALFCSVLEWLCPKYRQFRGTLTNSYYLGHSYNESNHIIEVFLDRHKADTFGYISEVTIH